MSSLASMFDVALSYQDFMAKFGTPADLPRWERTRGVIQLTEAQTNLLKSFTRTTNVLVLAGAWCGDCAGQCPAFEKFAEIAPMLKVRYLDRDAYPDAQAELKINGGNRVPVAVFMSEDGQEVSRFGERTLTAYRKLAETAGMGSGESCGTGIVSADAHLAGIVQDWLNEFERVQYILRLSPRLRRLHGD